MVVPAGGSQVDVLCWEEEAACMQELALSYVCLFVRLTCQHKQSETQAQVSQFSSKHSLLMDNKGSMIGTRLTVACMFDGGIAHSSILKRRSVWCSSTMMRGSLL